ncbi:MAG TPA: hypothetical protein VMP86_05740 [Candidatus Binatia bacterium]|nr:hypothetical protein [Candidatus Binatia bacterium]
MTRVLARPAVLAFGPLLITLLALAMGSAFADPGSLIVFAGYALGVVTAPLLLGWRTGETWARGLAWGIAAVLMAGSLFALLVGVWMFAYYENPVADFPLNIGLPLVGIIGSGLILWAVLRRQA